MQGDDAAAVEMVPVTDRQNDVKEKKKNSPEDLKSELQMVCYRKPYNYER